MMNGHVAQLVHYFFYIVYNKNDLRKQIICWHRCMAACLSLAWLVADSGLFLGDQELFVRGGEARKTRHGKKSIGNGGGT